MAASSFSIFNLSKKSGLDLEHVDITTFRNTPEDLNLQRVKCCQVFIVHCGNCLGYGLLCCDALESICMTAVLL